ncbi:oxidase [Candidatus Acidianus copahuensis]|uniref:Oxidase n=1 Tax=Candidatus Acidianus copahuensis TaxID=1160895 RepID=A0A031LM48_9CREN|nr:hypothetical protein [Candidatus Acidianus copahuensis]EZQ03221.1 oxidase [Candidatus Acidianus copahuensis]
MDKKERWELTWTLTVIVLFAFVIVSTFPLDFVVGGVPSVISELNGVPSQKIIQTHITSYQYLFKINESGAILSNELGMPFYYNLIVAHPGEFLNISMTSADVTSNFYFADYADKVVTDQIVPGLVEYDVLPVPNITGAYAFLGGEYNGPWYSYQTGLLISLPYSGYFTSGNISKYISQTQIAYTSALKGDPYNPPIVQYTSVSNPTVILVGDQYGVFNKTIPGPTIVVNHGSTVTLSMYMPLPNDERNYLYNYSASGTPYPVTDIKIGVYAIWWNGTITLVSEQPIHYNTYQTFSFNSTAPAYVYGIITPVYYNYNPSNLSGTYGSLIGFDKGYIMGAWGVILVEGN